VNEESGREGTPDLDDEHDGIARLMTRVELLERGDDGALDDRGVEERA
jgi:hypothetical protein